MLEPDNRKFAQTQSLRRLHAAVAGEEVALPIGQYRDIEAKALDAAGDLLQLPLAMEPGIARIDLELPDSHMLDAELAHCSASPLGRGSEVVP